MSTELIFKSWIYLLPSRCGHTRYQTRKSRWLLICVRTPKVTGYSAAACSLVENTPCMGRLLPMTPLICEGCDLPGVVLYLSEGYPPMNKQTLPDFDHSRMTTTPKAGNLLAFDPSTVKKIMNIVQNVGLSNEYETDVVEMKFIREYRQELLAHVSRAKRNPNRRMSWLQTLGARGQRRVEINQESIIRNAAGYRQTCETPYTMSQGGEKRLGLFQDPCFE